MGQERYETVDRLYRAALNVEPERRPAFLTGACRGDESLRKEVELLLGLEQQAEAFVRQPLPDFEARVYGMSNTRRFGPGEIVAGRFEIVTFISQGGMGDVYEATDLQLGDHVALKTVRPEYASNERMIAQFKQEILLAKKVTHPNVCRIYDVGFHLEQTDRENRSAAAAPSMFLTMELLRGEPLSSRISTGAMAPSEALAIVEQLAAGLDAAHEAGVVHRDFKPGNVLLVPSSNGRTRAVITDFGLARRVHKDQLATLSLTQGNIVGTPDYMAPEQLTGGEITPAVDIYALGIVMYEMIAGRRPFEADSALAVLAQRLHQNAPSPRVHVPDLDRKWESAILRCLEREPSKRFASTRDVIEALARPEPPRTSVRLPVTRRRMLYAGLASAGVLGGGAALWRAFRDPQPSIAILPLMNSDSTLDYLSEGITEDLINTLGQRKTLRVMSRAAVYRHKGTNLAPQEIGRTLNVRFLLTGRVVQQGDNTAVAVELTDTATGAHVWGQQYRRPLSEISAVEEDISREVLAKLQLEFGLDEGRRLASRRSVNPEANELYWKGRYFWNKRTQQGLKDGIEYFNQAIAKDPKFALAYTGLADCYAMQSGVLLPTEVFPKAKSFAQKALELDNTLAEAHASMAFTHLFFDWDWIQTEKEYQRAIQLNPNYASAHSMYGMYLVAMSRFDEALQQMKQALQLDPASLAINTGVGRVLYYARRYHDAAAQYEKTLELDPNFSEALFDLGRTRSAEGKTGEAIRFLERGLKVSQDAGAMGHIIHLHRRAGHQREAELWQGALQELTQKRYVSPYFRAVAHVGSNDEQALDFLEQAYGDRSFSMIYLNVDPQFDRLRSHLRYRALLQRLGFRING